jgi:short-subunit dehydrogenase
MAITLYDVATALGFVTLLTFVYNAATFFYLHFSPSNILTYRRQNAWVLVTGASDGIGKAFAEELCASGFNVILHGRNETKLRALKGELERRKAGVEIRIIVLDAAAQEEWKDEWDEMILSTVRGLKLTVLVNNVGGSGGVKPEFLAVKDRKANELDTMLNVNARFMMQITRVLLPVLIANQPSAILNVSSAAELIPAPYAIVYSASKAYVNMWSRSLDVEMRTDGHDVKVTNLVVAKVVTRGAGRTEKDKGFDTCMPSDMASACLHKMGNGYSNVVPYLPHAMQVAVLQALPAWVQEMMIKALIKAEMEGLAKARKED